MDGPQTHGYRKTVNQVPGGSIKHYHREREGPSPRAAITPPPPFSTPHTLPSPPNPHFRKLTHSTQEQENAEPHGGLPPGSARKDGVSELILPCALTPALFSLSPASPTPPGHSFMVSTSHLFARSSMVYHLFSLSRCLSLSVISRFTYLPALSSAGHLESHFYCPPVTHDAPPDPFVSAPWISVGWWGGRGQGRQGGAWL